MAQLLKDKVDRSVVEDLARGFSKADGQLDASQSVEGLLAELPALELGPRIEAITRRLAERLNPDYKESLAAWSRSVAWTRGPQADPLLRAPCPRAVR